MSRARGRVVSAALRVPNPLDSDESYARYHHADLEHLDLCELVVEIERATVAIALARREDDREWWLRRRVRVRAELSRRGWRA